MIELERLTVAEVEEMTYNELIPIFKETNRPPGGRSSLLRVAERTRMGRQSRVLEVGTSTGFSAIELSRYTNARIHAIDINAASIEEAQRRARLHGPAVDITFERQDATDLSFSDEAFDVVLCGNVTSLIAERSKALAEYSRVLRPNGFLAAIPMYYIQEPPKQLVAEVSTAIGVDITVQRRDDWLDFFAQPPLAVFDIEDYCFDHLTPDRVQSFVSEITGRAHLEVASKEVGAALIRRYTNMMQLFRVNLTYMGFSILLLRKEPEVVEPELFTSTIVRQ